MRQLKFAAMTTHPTSTQPARSRVQPLKSPPATHSLPVEEEPRAPAPFPLDALPDFMRAIAEAGAAASNTPITLTGPLTLAAHSVAMGSGLELDCGGSLRCFGNLHMLGIAESGTGKSEAAKVILAPIRKAQKAILEQWMENDLPQHKARSALLKRQVAVAEKDNDQSTLARLIRERDSAELAASEKGRPLLYAGNVTREALAAAIALAPGQAFAIINPDARGLIGIIAGKYSGGKASDEDIYLAGYSGDSMPSLRVGSGFINLDKPCLATCLLIQPDAFDDLRRKEIFAQSGWLQRNLLFDSRASFDPLPATPPAVPDPVMSAWREHLDALIEQVRGAEYSRLVTTSPASRAMMLEKGNGIRARIKNGDLHDVASFACRWAEQANRIALGLHQARYRDPGEAAARPLEESTMEAAWRLDDWFSQEQMRLLSNMREDRKLERVTRLIDLLSRQGGERKLSRCKLAHHNGFSEEEMLSLAAAFPAKLELGQTPSGRVGGRPGKWVRAR